MTISNYLHQQGWCDEDQFRLEALLKSRESELNLNMNSEVPDWFEPHAEDDIYSLSDGDTYQVLDSLEMDSFLEDQCDEYLDNILDNLEPSWIANYVNRDRALEDMVEDEDPLNYDFNWVRLHKDDSDFFYDYYVRVW